MAVGENTFSVEILTPEGSVFAGDVVQLSTRTAVGEVGILANHAPIMALLRPTELRLRLSESETRRYAQSHGVLQVFGNHAEVLIEQAVPVADLDEATLRQELADAEQRASESPEESAARDRAEKDRERAEAFLAIAKGG
ncbi:MAG: ATP synthase F1 subunit epsilon [Solirubrobacterales bacterium]